MALATLLYFVAYIGVGAAIIYALVLLTKISETLKDINNKLRDVNSKPNKDIDA